VELIFFRDGSHPYYAVTGNLTITSFDTVNQVMSGKFQFNGTLNNSLLHITLGTFDNLRYRKQ